MEADFEHLHDILQTTNATGDIANGNRSAVDEGPISQNFQVKIESAVRKSRANAENRLAEMEREMCDVFLDTDLDETDSPLPEFGRHADAMTDAISRSFFDALLDENESLTEQDVKWVKGASFPVLNHRVARTDRNPRVFSPTKTAPEANCGRRHVPAVSSPPAKPPRSHT